MMAAVCSNTMEEYFFPGITFESRLMYGFIGCFGFFFIAFVIRIYHNLNPPAWGGSNKEPLRYIRDAYRAGCALRERRYRMLLSNPNTTMQHVCDAEDVDANVAQRYLRVVRYLTTHDAIERRALLLDSSSTIQSLNNTLMLKIRGGAFADPGEKATAEGLVGVIVPVTQIQQAYRMGKKVREAAYRIWEEHQDVVIMGSTAATIMSIRQFACIECDCTMPQAERYCRLVRSVDASGQNPWQRLFELSMLSDREGEDNGEPVPSALATVVEPVRMSQAAFEKADMVCAPALPPCGVWASPSLPLSLSAVSPWSANECVGVGHSLCSVALSNTPPRPCTASLPCNLR
jgi:hypothetical protein